MTTVLKPGTYVVGEEGPETVVVPVASDAGIEVAVRALDYALAALNRPHVDIEEVHAEVRIARRVLTGDRP